MAKSNTAVKPNAWSWQTPKGKTYVKGAWPTREEAIYAAEAAWGGHDFKIVRVYVTPVK